MISKTSAEKPTAAVPTRRNHEDIADRLRQRRPSAGTLQSPVPKFARAQTQVTRDTIEIAEDASLSEILDQWKREGDKGNSTETETPVPAQPVAVASVERVKTRLLGFDDVVAPDPFEATTAAPLAATTRFPVGWLVIIDGPGRGESYTLLSGMSQIGRGTDQAVMLDHGDEAISRSNHAAIVYDIESHSFLMGHGGKANVVRLNDKPLITTETLKSGDIIRIGETSLQLVVFSTADFNWSSSSEPEAENVAIS